MLSLSKQSPIHKQFILNASEIKSSTQGYIDPIGDQLHLKAPQIIHRYENRVLFLPTQICPINCRYCFRKNEIHHDQEIFKKANLDSSIDYLQNHPEIKEIIFSGGDPLILSNKKINYYLECFSSIKHIQYIRFHSRVPVVLPERLDDELKEIIEKWSSRFSFHLAIHTNHWLEWSKPGLTQLRKIQFWPWQLLSQSVLLKGVNNDVHSLQELFTHLYNFKVRPYYLHHPDLVAGGEFYYMSLDEGRKIYSQLRDLIPTWCLPHYVIDPPTGVGKSIIGQVLTEKGSHKHQILSRKGNIYHHVEIIS